MKSKTYKSEILMACHKTAEAMYEAGLISKEEMLEYDEDCLVQNDDHLFDEIFLETKATRV